jgi:isochorismate synthase
MGNRTATTQISQRDFLSEALPFYYDSNFSFALWRLPNGETVHFAASDRVQKLKEINMEGAAPGFIFAPFDPSHDKIFLPADEIFVFKSGNIISSQGSAFEARADRRPAPASRPARKNYYTSSSTPGASLNESAYKQLVENAREEVAKGTFEKIVPSRFKVVTLSEDFDLLQSFDDLCALYPHALVSAFSSPTTGTWVGATPELLASITRDQHFIQWLLPVRNPIIPKQTSATFPGRKKRSRSKRLSNDMLSAASKKFAFGNTRSTAPELRLPET